MATVRVKAWGGSKERRESVEDYVVASTDSHSPHVDDWTRDQADNTAHALGRLVEILVDLEVLDEAALAYIVGVDAPSIINLRRNSNAEKI